VLAAQLVEALLAHAGLSPCSGSRAVVFSSSA
jgi:hypothetical protein